MSDDNVADSLLPSDKDAVVCNKDAVTGCIEKSTFSPDEKKKTLWGKIKEIWAALNEDGKEEKSRDSGCCCRSYKDDDDDDDITMMGAMTACMGANV